MGSDTNGIDQYKIDIFHNINYNTIKSTIRSIT